MLLTQSIRENFVYQTTLGNDSLWTCQRSSRRAPSTVTTKSSIHGNYYQMAIIDVKSKNVWDFHLETKIRYILS